MSIPDEPLFNEESSPEDSEPEVDPSLQERIHRLLDGQPFAVLCTQGDTQPYGSLVSFVASEDLRVVVFATPTFTRKYRLLSGCNKVALLFDTRDKHQNDISQIEAVTATGRAIQINSGEQFDYWADKLVQRHAYLSSLVKASSCALFRIDIVRYLHVVRLQEVKQWIPHHTG
jgi:uncharacterized protein YhbP (UPF0306 family)